MSSSRLSTKVRSSLGRLSNGRGNGAPDPLVRVRARLDRQRARLDAHGRRLDTQREKLGELRAALTAIGKDFRDRLAPIERRDRIRELEHARLTAQVGAVEERLGRLEALVTDPRVVAVEGAQEEAIDVLDAVRREHEQIRVRMQIISSYEERLRRVEASVIAMYDGDHRHQV